MIVIESSNINAGYKKAGRKDQESTGLWHRLNILTDDCQPHETVRTEREGWRIKDEGGRGDTNMEKTTEAQGQICMFRVKHG